MYKRLNRKNHVEKFASKIIQPNIINNDNYTQIISEFEARFGS